MRIHHVLGQPLSNLECSSAKKNILFFFVYINTNFGRPSFCSDGHFIYLYILKSSVIPLSKSLLRFT